MSVAKYPWRITFDTNPDLCNRRCIMCERHSDFAEKSRQNRIMPFDMIEKVVAETAPLGLREIIPSTMGEPLLYADFERIVELCRRYKIKLNLTTNGSFPKRGAKDWAEIIVPVTSDVKFSWNGAAKKTYESVMIGSVWEESLRNLKTFIAVRDEHFKNGGSRCRVTFQVTFMEINTPELADIVKTAVDFGVDRVKGHHLWVNSREMSEENMRRSPDSVKRWNEAVKKALRAAEEYKLADGRSVILENIRELDYDAGGELVQNGVCPFLGQEAWFNTKGEFAPCCAPDELRKTLGDFGNINEKSFADIWESAQYKKLIENYNNNPLCKTCNMRRTP